MNRRTRPAYEIAASALAFSLLRQIAQLCADEGRCSLGTLSLKCVGCIIAETLRPGWYLAEIIHDDPEHCPAGRAFDALQTLRLVDVDIDGDGHGVVQVTEKGRAYLWLAGSEAGRGLLRGAA